MKQTVVYIILVVVILTAVRAHVQKINLGEDDTNFERVVTSLKKADYIVPQATNIAVNNINAHIIFDMLFCYILAPRYFTHDTSGKYDTVLHVCTEETADSIMSHIPPGKQLIWQDKIPRNQFFITCSKK